jgi:Zn finger protein HypA/HybF involved in hydrogenase expression
MRTEKKWMTPAEVRKMFPGTVAVTDVLVPVYCHNCGRSWKTSSDYPTCPKCKSTDVGENYDNQGE